MKSIFKIWLLPVVSVVLFIQCEKEVNPYDPVYIPDTDFIDALIEEGVDANGDGKISYEEASHVTELDVHGKGISEMTGLEAFENLETLVCDINELTNLNVSHNTKLKRLICWANQLTSLDVSNNTELEWLWCNHNQLTSLNVSNNFGLKGLSCEDNDISHLDVSKNSFLARLYCGENELKSLDVSGNLYLVNLECGSNRINYLDVANCRALAYLNVQHMPTLSSVCVWTMPFPPAGTQIHMEGSPNVYFTTECSK